ncbi:MAG TPA: YdiU family protein, partial [Rhodospirillales bacterium]|nr:YdiU family protein [Rhodospirillales bacterium]
AEELGVDGALETDDAAAIFAGNRVPPGADPIAMAYAGHQFGYFVPRLGDGRAILLGEVIDRHGRRRDIQLKGAGRTRFARGGDGRAALGPVLREYLVSEAMHAFGIPGTRALAAVTTGEPVYREEVLPGAILTRVAASHIRIGTFQYFASRGDGEAVQCLADYVIDRHGLDASLPDINKADVKTTDAKKDDSQPYLALLGVVVERQAALVARWMHVGFIHGVMNTDNMTVSGETIDYGPCAFMDAYDPDTVFSAIDHHGRYAFVNQPGIAQWNLARFAETLLPLIDPEPQKAVERASGVIAEFSARFESHWITGMRRKLGLRTAEDGDMALVQALLEMMHASAADFTLTFQRLCDAAEDHKGHAAVRGLFERPQAYDQWAAAWHRRLEREPGTPSERAALMRDANPAVIPRNHRVEEALAAAVERGDFKPFEALLQVLSRPYEDRPEAMPYAAPPEPSERVFQTFCGT